MKRAPAEVREEFERRNDGRLPAHWRQAIAAACREFVAGGKEILRAMLSKDAATNFSKTRLAPTIVKGLVPSDGFGSTALVSQTKMLDAAGIPHMPNPSHIVPVMVGDAAKCKWISDLLLDNYGIYVQPINYPTVPKKTERLRITPTPLHTDADIEHLVGALHALWSRCALARAVA